MCRRPTDFVARYGGEEFGIILPNTPKAGAMTFARALQSLVRTRGLPHPDSPVSEHVTLSGGITTVMPDDDTTVQSLIMRADAAATEIYAAFDAAAARIEKQLRRHKSRIKAHKGRGAAAGESLAAQYYVIDGEAEGDLGRQLAALQTPDAATGIGDGILGDRARRDPCRYAERGAADSR